MKEGEKAKNVFRGFTWNLLDVFFALGLVWCLSLKGFKELRLWNLWSLTVLYSHFSFRTWIGNRIMGGVSFCFIQLSGAISSAAVCFVWFIFFCASLLCVCVPLCFFLQTVFVSSAQWGADNASANSLLSSTQSKPPVGTSIIAWHRKQSMKQQLGALTCPVWGRGIWMLLGLILQILCIQARKVNHRFCLNTVLGDVLGDKDL